jgi:hypothetical protein
MACNWYYMKLNNYIDNVAQMGTVTAVSCFQCGYPKCGTVYVHIPLSQQLILQKPNIESRIGAHERN